ncbi:hypothetical protein TrRE_jg2086, partial [Triparma retinervis]
TVKKNPLRVYVDVHIGGYFLEAISPNLTKVTYLVGCDLKGVFAIDWMARRAGPHHLKEAVLRSIDVADKIKRGVGMGGGIAHESAKKKFGQAMDFGGSNDEEEGTFEMTNVHARNVEKTRSPLHEDI